MRYKDVKNMLMYCLPLIMASTLEIAICVPCSAGCFYKSIRVLFDHPKRYKSSALGVKRC